MFDDLRELIKCDFVGNGVWKSKDLDPDYVNEAAKKSREKRKKSGTLTAKKVSYYDEELGVTLYYRTSSRSRGQNPTTRSSPIRHPGRIYS